MEAPSQYEPQAPRVHKGIHTPSSNQRQPHPGTEKGTAAKGSHRHENLTNGHAPTQSQTQLTKSGCNEKVNRKEHPAKLYISEGNQSSREDNKAQPLGLNPNPPKREG